MALNYACLLRTVTNLARNADMHIHLAALHPPGR